MLQYDTIFNNPYERRRITYSHVWWDNAFTDDQLKLIEEICEREPLDEGTIVNNEDKDELNKIRKSKVKFYNKNNENSFIFDTFNQVGQALNNQFYNFNLNGYESFQYTVYDGEEQGKYSWHMDMITNNDVLSIPNMDTRKLTLILLLSEPEVDFSGGELQLNLGQESSPTTVDMPRGRIVAFPSWFLHQVKPVLTGVRKSIVVWIEGPKFI